MGTIDEIKQMKREGRTDQEIANLLKQRGLSSSEIANSISQAQIKEAVYGGSEQNYDSNQYQIPEAPSPNSDQYPQQDYSGMTPSMMVQEQPAPEMQPEINQDYNSGYSDYQQYSQNYQPYQQQALSADTMSEIAEQVVSEKINQMTKKVDKLVESKNQFETKIENLTERLQRIEKIIDKLQLSILQKVGDYIGDVSDLKKELIETQKTFKAITSDKQHKKHTS